MEIKTKVRRRERKRSKRLKRKKEKSPDEGIESALPASSREATLPAPISWRQTHPRCTNSHVPLQLQGATSLPDASFAWLLLLRLSAAFSAFSTTVMLSPHQQIRHVATLLPWPSPSCCTSADAAACGCASGGFGERARAREAATGMVSGEARKGKKREERVTTKRERAHTLLTKKRKHRPLFLLLASLCLTFSAAFALYFNLTVLYSPLSCLS
jgi:hypothetical protein